MSRASGWHFQAPGLRLNQADQQTDTQHNSSKVRKSRLEDLAAAPAWQQRHLNNPASTLSLTRDRFRIWADREEWKAPSTLVPWQNHSTCAESAPDALGLFLLFWRTGRKGKETSRVQTGLQANRSASAVSRCPRQGSLHDLFVSSEFLCGILPEHTQISATAVMTTSRSPLSSSAAYSRAIPFWATAVMTTSRSPLSSSVANRRAHQNLATAVMTTSRSPLSCFAAYFRAIPILGHGCHHHLTVFCWDDLGQRSDQPRPEPLFAAKRHGRRVDLWTS